CLGNGSRLGTHRDTGSDNCDLSNLLTPFEPFCQSLSVRFTSASVHIRYRLWFPRRIHPTGRLQVDAIAPSLETGRDPSLYRSSHLRLSCLSSVMGSIPSQFPNAGFISWDVHFRAWLRHCHWRGFRDSARGYVRRVRYG